MYKFSRVARHSDTRKWFIHFIYTNNKGFKKDSYLSITGSIIECSRYGSNTPSEIWYETRELAQEALDRFNKKGNVMDTSKLTTGMIVVQKNGDTMLVLRGTANGDILSGENSWRPLHDTQFFPDFNFSDRYSIVAVYQPKNNMSYSLHVFDKKGLDDGGYNVVWEYKKEPTVMTIAEIQKKLGIDNLHIKD